MEKIKVSIQLLDAFNRLAYSCVQHKSEIVRDWLDEKGRYISNLKELNNIDFDTLIALVYGNYELEETPEQKLLVYYQNLDCQTTSSGVIIHTMCASTDNAWKVVEDTLNILDIEIEGINK